jgi:hypothetical protein
MNDIAVLMPFGNGTPWRRRALEYTRSWYAENLEGARILMGFTTGEWCKAEAVASALARSSEEVVIVADADSVTPGLRQAVRAVREGAAWAVPHLKVYRMSQEATGQIYSGASPGSLTGQNRWLDQSPYKGYEGGGITVLRREVYLNCPLDPEFRGWGQEDEAWAMALNGLYGAPWRGKAPLYHLWHEKPPRLSRYAGSETSLSRLQEYREARIHDTWNVLLEQARRSAQGDGDPCKVAI